MKSKTEKSETRKLGLICGGGNLPLNIIDNLKKQKKDFFLLCLKGFADPKKIPTELPQAWVRLGAGGAAIRELRKANVKDLIFAGSISRPNWKSLIPDFYTLKVLFKKALSKKSTDELFRALFEHIESEGFKILPVQDFAPEIVLKPGLHGYTPKLSKEVMTDIEFGSLVSYHIGACDAGQSAVVQQKIALSLEGEDGTDATIKRGGKLKKPGSKPILVKLPKPGQEMRVDLPAVGTGTLNSVIEAGFQGIVILEDGAMIVDKEEVFALCKKHKVFIYVLSHKEYERIITTKKKVK